MTYRLSFCSAFSLPTAPILRVFACDRAEYAKHRGVNRCEHLTGKIVGWCRSAPRRRQVERDDPNLLEADQLSQLVHAELTNGVSNDSGSTI
ncbi:hypothetical protein [Sphingomonas sp. HMP9]|uniref:hypothetical protein n=1 Tax=Sphingomonas sp. HMP9 TaxID=1517554 RepID=UPI001597181A|nr:hypothetical protein [Sphingomonas sp. HMP9]